MLDAASEAIAFVKGRQRDSLDRDRMLVLALTRLLEVIGEAARGLSTEFRAAHPEVPWPKIAGMRDRLIHGYFDVNLDIVWETVTKDLPPLVVRLAGMTRA
jgi:uncharacterized protein with HEPN domain